MKSTAATLGSDHCLFALAHPVARAIHEASDIMNCAYTSLSVRCDLQAARPDVAYYHFDLGDEAASRPNAIVTMLSELGAMSQPARNQHCDVKSTAVSENLSADELRDLLDWELIMFKQKN